MSYCAEVKSIVLYNYSEGQLRVMNTQLDSTGDDESSDDGNHKGQGYCHFNDGGSNKIFSINLFGHNLDIEQDPSSQLIGHGAVVWDAAVIFSKYMEYDPKQFSAEKLHGKSVIELGSGCGLGGFAFMMKGAKVMLTDMQKVTEALTESNANRLFSQLNSLGKGALPYPVLQHSVLALDWTDFKSFENLGKISGNSIESFDVVLLTDCVFSAQLAIPLVNCIRNLTSTHSVVYCCHEIRDEVRAPQIYC